MERRVFEAALRAAAKVTFGGPLIAAGATSLLGCGGLVQIEQAESEADDPPPAGGYTAGADGGHAPSGGGYAPSDGGYASSDGGSMEVPLCAQPPEPPGGWGVYDQATFDCCVERIAGDPPDPAIFDQDVSACCSQILQENYSSIWQGTPLVHDAPQAVIDSCCVFAHGNVGCTPWGPPCPVALDPGDTVPWVMDALGEHPVPLGRLA